RPGAADRLVDPDPRVGGPPGRERFLLSLDERPQVFRARHLPLPRPSTRSGAQNPVRSGGARAAPAPPPGRPAAADPRADRRLPGEFRTDGRDLADPRP